MFPFNGSYKNPLRDLYTFFRYILPQGLKNLVVYAPVIFWTREWDSTYLYQLIVFKLKQMEADHQKYQVISDWKRVSNEMKVARLALERVIKDEYPGFLKFYKQGYASLDDYKKDYQMQREDIKLFARQFVKYSDGWWS